MKADKNWCMSSYLTFRYVAKKNLVFKTGLLHKEHELIADSDKFKCKDADEIDFYIKKVLNEYDLSKSAIFLSGGMDSSILASYLPKGARAYTSKCVGQSAVDETERAKEICDICGLKHIIVDVSWNDYVDSMSDLALHDGSPIIPNEPQAYMMAKRAVRDGATLLIYGDCADTEFGGMNKMLERDWTFDERIKRFTFLEPEKVLKKPANVNEIYEHYRVGSDNVNFIDFIRQIYVISASGASSNAIRAVGAKHVDPYEHLKMESKFDLKRIRSGDTKYLIRDLFKMKYPQLPILEKLPMSRPAEEWLKDWNGPKRDEFLPNCVEKLTGEQKLLVYSLERFLNLIE